ncbi:MAG TPA: methyl-accepting chemotaxis protein [Telluria sp.]|nr:methyl-accepting chemotaxis protein [Telluria sp.]
MRIVRLHTGAKVLGAFGIVLLVITLISAVSLWRMQAADSITSDLVRNKFPKQQLASELLGAVRLDGVRTLAIARSDSLELSDYFHAQLAQGAREQASIEARLSSMANTGAEQELLRASQARKAAFNRIQAEIFQFKERGQTQEVERLAGAELQAAIDAHLAALKKLVEHQAAQANHQAAVSASDSASSRAIVGVLGALALLVGCTLALLLARSITHPLKRAVALAERVATGDLRASIEHSRTDEMGRLFDALNAMTEGVSATVARVLEGARAVDGASSEIAAGNADLSMCTERQAGTLVETAGAMDELTAAVAQNDSSTAQANKLAHEASAVALEAMRAVGQVVEKMAAIEASGIRISEITSVIDGIAFQTNILALNAAVEAARAGEEGRGFAVVAGEVRNLAQRSAAAARDIKHLITESAQQIGAGRTIANNAGDTMRDVLESVQRVTVILAAIKDATSEQASRIGSIGRAISELDGDTQQNAAMVEQAAAGAHSMREQAAHLAALVSTFQLKPAPGQAARSRRLPAQALAVAE